MTLPLLVPNNFRIIAHRGASAYAPENTNAAFKLAADMGVREFEIDTQLSSDGQVVLCHEFTLEKYGNGNSVVEEIEWNELKQLDMGSWFSPFLFQGERMITLTELFNEYMNNITYHIEIKGRANKLPEHVCKIILDYGLASNCIITSFSLDSLISVQTLYPGFELGWLVQQITPEVLSKAERFNFVQICPRADTVSSEIVALAHQTVSEVRAWGVDGKRQEVLSLINNALDANCDGITINWPDWLKHEESI